MQPVFIVKLFLAFIGLGVFGWWYNRLVAALEAEHGRHGYTAMQVIGGELMIHATAFVVVIGSGIIPEMAVLVDLALHVPAGLPMTLGSIGRHLREEREEVRRAEGIARESLRR